METSINAIINTKCFNCKDKGTVVVTSETTRNKAVVIPCPICNPQHLRGSDKQSNAS